MPLSHWKCRFKVALDSSWDVAESLPSLFSAAENTNKMAAAMLSATLSQSVWLVLLVLLWSCHWSPAKPFAQTINTVNAYPLLSLVSLQVTEKSLFLTPKCDVSIRILTVLFFWSVNGFRMIFMMFSPFTELSFLQTRSRRICVCVLVVTNPKRGALLLHVWRISITKRLRICVWIWVRDTGRRERERLNG